MMDKIQSMFQELQPMTTSKAVVRISRKLFMDLPRNDNEFIEVCNALMDSREWIMFQMVTTWIKMRKTVYQLPYFADYQKWLQDYTDGWGACDILCYRVLNPMIEKFPDLFETAVKWSQSEKVYVRRASAVCLICSGGYSFSVNVPFDRVKTICDSLQSDRHIHIQKAVGWLLKYAYLTYPEEVQEYLQNNASALSRTTYRYALKKMPPAIKAYYMNV